MFNTEKAFDLLPSVVDLYDKLDIDGYKKKITEKNKGKDKKDISNESLGIDLFKYIFKNSAKVKEEVFEIVSILEEKSVEEIKAQNPVKTMNTIKEIFSNKDAIDFLKQAM